MKKNASAPASLDIGLDVHKAETVIARRLLQMGVRCDVIALWKVPDTSAL